MALVLAALATPSNAKPKETRTNTFAALCPWLTQARTPHGSQFFICYDAFPHLDGVHTVFGQVVEGMEHVDKIKQGDKMKEVTISE